MSGRNSPRGIVVERQSPQGHQHHFDDLHDHNHGPLAESIRKDTGKDGHEHQRQGEDDKDEGRLGLGRGLEFRAGSYLRGQLLDGQQRDHQLPRVVIERPEELGNKQPTKRRTVWVTFAVAH